MPGRTLKLSPQLSLPLDVAGEAIAILAKRGAGKTNTATVLVEELYRADVQTVVLDPVGVWWGLRSSYDGDKAGLKVAVIGGQHGDVPLEEAGEKVGRLIADVAVDSGQSLVIDLSDFPSKKSMQSFVVDFAQRLYTRKARDQSLLNLILEEADVFAPQAVRGGGQAGEQHYAIEQIVRRGRSRGIGITMITQRSAVLNKDVLTQADVLIAMRTTGPQDIKAIGDWVNARGDEHGKEVLQSLPSLATGEAWVWNPEHEILKRTKVRARRTFDSSRTPKAGERRAEPRHIAEIDPAALGEQIAATAERARANDPKELRKMNADLNRRLEQAERTIERLGRDSKVVEQRTERVVEKIEIPVLGEKEIKQLGDVVGKLASISTEIAAAAKSIDSAVERAAKDFVEGIRKIEREASKPAPPPRRVLHPEPSRRPAQQPRAQRPADLNGGEGELTGPQQRVLDALAWLEAVGFSPATKIQTGFIARYRVGKKVGGTFGNVLGSLNSDGLIHYPTPGSVQLTPEGRSLAHPPEIEPTTEALQAAIHARLDGPESRVLQVLIETYPEPLDKKELGERAGYTVSDKIGGTFGNILGRLRSLGLIEYPGPGLAVAQPVLFLEEAFV